jgi:hypothetical protein
VSAGRHTTLSNEYDVRFLLVWLLGVPGLVVLTWALVAG